MITVKKNIVSVLINSIGGTRVSQTFRSKPCQRFYKNLTLSIIVDDFSFFWGEGTREK